MRQGVFVYPDGREVCLRKTEGGQREYRRRTEAMRQRQGGRCCLEGFAPGCSGYLRKGEATFEHEDGRGMGSGRRDDRIEKDGRPYNGAAHLQCNMWKGSRRIDYNNQNVKSGE